MIKNNYYINRFEVCSVISEIYFANNELIHEIILSYCENTLFLQSIIR